MTNANGDHQSSSTVYIRDEFIKILALHSAVGGSIESLVFSNFVGSLYIRRIPFSDYLDITTVWQP